MRYLPGGRASGRGRSCGGDEKPHPLTQGLGSPVDVGRLCRSEEHTSELQSRLHLVCRLLLEKKIRCCHLKNIWTAPLPPETELSRQMTTSTTSIDIMGLQAAYANLHTDQERDYFMQRYHDVISSFGGKTSYDADNLPLLVFFSNPSASEFYTLSLHDALPI